MNQAQFERQCLQAHNAYRKAHGSCPLQADPAVSNEAQQWAEHIAKMGRLSHSHKQNLGENVAFTSGSATGFTITKMWYDEVQNYSWQKHGSSNGQPVGHFTQVVWNESTHAGFGIATGPRGTFAVGNYKPAGNMMMAGYYEKNVGRKQREPDLPQSTDKPCKDSGTHQSRKAPFAPSRSDCTDGRKMPKPGTTVETKTETYTEDGERKKKTTTITTTVTETPNGGYKTSTQTQTQIETIPEGYSDAPSALSAGVKGLKVDSDSSEDEKENDMSTSDKKKFRKDCLQQINDFRRKHGACGVEKSNALQKTAQKHANKMLRDHDLSLYKGGRVGQCLSMRQPRPKGKEVIDQWYGENKDYNFKKAEFVKGSGNFTQIVWKDSKDVGIGVASDEKGETYVIAMFDPPGNVKGQFGENVKSAK